MVVKKPRVIRPRLREKRKPAAFIRTQMKSAAEDVLGIGFWKRMKTAAVPEIPHPFLAELISLPLGFGLLGGALGSVVDDDDAVKRYALTAGLAGLGTALGRGAGAKFFPNATKNVRGLVTGAGLGAGVSASDQLLPELGYEPVIGNDDS